jgi:hypothetical protein
VCSRYRATRDFSVPSTSTLAIRPFHCKVRRNETSDAAGPRGGDIVGPCPVSSSKRARSRVLVFHVVAEVIPAEMAG